MCFSEEGDKWMGGKDLIINLRDTTLFESDSLQLDKKATFILGKNGTGKTTLTDIIAKQSTEYETHVFKGFDNIIDKNEKLNAVVLGEENTLINKQIVEIEEKIEEKNKDKETVLATLSEPDSEGVTNFWTRLNNAEKRLVDAKNSIKDFYTQSAAKIRDNKGYRLSTSSYNKNNFEREIANASRLSEQDRLQLEDILKSTVKTAKEIEFPTNDVGQLLIDVNNLLARKVAEKNRISRLGDDKDKIAFAKEGLNIHKKGDICSFCGSKIDDDIFDELEGYFSADEVKDFQNEINEEINRISATVDKLSEITVDIDDFYPSYVSRASEISDQINKKIDEYRRVLIELKTSLEEKRAELFSESDRVNIDIPEDFNKIEAKYRKLVQENNDNDINARQEEAQEKLRLHFIKILLDDFDYSSKVAKLQLYESAYEQAQDEFDKEKERITGKGGIDETIRGYREDVIKLQQSTKNEELLAIRINKKLKHMVSFELELCKDDEAQGNYKVRDIYSGEIREIKKLSTGEKNIIAFLYFLEKLDEIKDDANEDNKLVIFDDPMNSNDDNMQYLIIEELDQLRKSLKAEDKFILLTHNKHFYINAIYNVKKEKEVGRVHLVKKGKQTAIQSVKKEDDIKTSYDSLWAELIYLYNSDAAAEMIINPIRRIIETFTKFNALNQSKFCDKVLGAKKLFDVNSHSIDDLEADLSGKTKDEIASIFFDCFSENRHEDHFFSHWPEYAKIQSGYEGLPDSAIEK